MAGRRLFESLRTHSNQVIQRSGAAQELLEEMTLPLRPEECGKVAAGRDDHSGDGGARGLVNTKPLGKIRHGREDTVASSF